MRRYLVRLLFFINDILFLLFSFFAAFYIKNEILYHINDNKPGYFLEHISLVTFALILWIINLMIEGTYVFDEKIFHQKIYRIIKAGTSSFLILIALLFAGKISHNYSRIIIFSFFFIQLIILPLSRIFLEKILKSIGLFQKNTVILGLKEDYSYFLEHFGEQFKSYNIVKEKMLYDSSNEMIDDVLNRKLLGEQLFVLAKSLRVKKLVRILRYLEGKYFYIKILPEIGEFDFANMDIYQLDGNLILEGRYNLLSPFRNILKRVFDLILGGIILIFSLPLMLIISILIKLDSKGPVIFGHLRFGKNKKIFKCWKFRTMVSNAEDILEQWFDEKPDLKKEYEKDFKLKDDPRITKLGSFLRKTSLDELPQIFNVIIGDMSLVGPRPIVEQEVKKYGDYGETLFRVTPGITGLWQISGRNDIDYKDRIELDMYYIKNWTLWLDIVIMVKTIPAIIKRKGAY